jgi:hypothetical protein
MHVEEPLVKLVVEEDDVALVGEVLVLPALYEPTMSCQESCAILCSAVVVGSKLGSL